ncbi:MAG: hypothetical protein DGJ47_000465 [Rickettsiaceae bacterium]
MNTIFAQCSAPGKAGVAIFRISGPNALKALSEIIGHDYAKLEARKMYFKKIYNPKNKQLIDEAMVVYFKGKSSFTGEDSAEIYTHGSLAVIKMMHQAMIAIDDVRMAEPGEYARRSFLNGKMDLTSAEGLADLIEAETEMQHKQAVNQLGGALERVYEEWRVKLLEIMGLIEVYIDFPDEDIPATTQLNVQKNIQELIHSISHHLDDNNRGERLRNGIKLAIVGRPNVGKSSLINNFMKRDLAIVSDIAGTTRDVIEGHLDISGYPIILQDTAGINDHSNDAIEQQGISKAWNVAKESDIKIIMCDSSQQNSQIELFKEIVDHNTIILVNKIDLNPENDMILAECKKFNVPIIKLSIKKQMGVKNLYNEVVNIAQKIASPSDTPQITRARYRAQLENAVDNLQRFALQDDLVLAAEDIRMTVQAISNITGKITVDEILGEIFSNFCIGK